jgi:hypothetical protein
MDPLRSWVDADEVRRLAARLIEPARDPATPVPAGEPGFDEGFVGFTGERSATAEPSAATTPTPPPATKPTPPPAPEPSFQPRERDTPAPAPQSARGPFLEKIRRFREWMGREFGAAGVFILDREGAVIFDDGLHDRLHFLARSLALASRRPATGTGNVHVKIGAGTTLEVIPVETAYGCLVLGAVVPGSLPPASVQAVMEALASIASPGER